MGDHEFVKIKSLYYNTIKDVKIKDYSLGLFYREINLIDKLLLLLKNEFDNENDILCDKINTFIIEICFSFRDKLNEYKKYYYEEIIEVCHKISIQSTLPLTSMCPDKDVLRMIQEKVYLNEHDPRSCNLGTDVIEVWNTYKEVLHKYKN